MRDRSALRLLLTAFALTACTQQPWRTSDAPGDPDPAASVVAPDVPVGQIAYAAGADHQIFLLDLVTGESRQLTELTGEHAELEARGPLTPALSCGFGVASIAWSPRGTQLAFSYGACDTVVYVVDLEGTLTRVGDGRLPAWSPDGGRLVFSPNTPFCMGALDCGAPPHPGAWDLQVVDVDADGPPVPLMLDVEVRNPAFATWAPDGSSIAFGAPTGRADPHPVNATYVADDDGTDVRHVIDGAVPTGWLPDGRLLVVEESTRSMHAIDLDSGDATALGGSLEGSALVSPDGARIAANISHPETGLTGVQLAALDGTVLMQRPGTVFAWAPDGRAIAILDVGEPGHLVVVDRDGTELRTYELADPVNAWALAWRPGS